MLPLNWFDFDVYVNIFAYLKILEEFPVNADVSAKIFSSDDSNINKSAGLISFL